MIETDSGSRILAAGALEDIVRITKNFAKIVPIIALGVAYAAAKKPSGMAVYFLVWLISYVAILLFMQLFMRKTS